MFWCLVCCSLPGRKRKKLHSEKQRGRFKKTSLESVVELLPDGGDPKYAKKRLQLVLERERGAQNSRDKSRAALEQIFDSQRLDAGSCVSLPVVDGEVTHPSAWTPDGLVRFSFENIGAVIPHHLRDSSRALDAIGCVNWAFRETQTVLQRTLSTLF